MSWFEKIQINTRKIDQCFSQIRVNMFLIIQHSWSEFSRAVTFRSCVLQYSCPDLIGNAISYRFPTYDNMCLQICLSSPNMSQDLKIYASAELSGARATEEAASSIFVMTYKSSRTNWLATAEARMGDDADRAFATETSLKQQIAGETLKSLALGTDAISSSHINWEVGTSLIVLVLYCCSSFECIYTCIEHRRLCRSKNKQGPLSFSC